MGIRAEGVGRIFGFCMNKPDINSIVPVCNQPEQTHHCMARPVEHTPEARSILKDNACDRKAEIILHGSIEVSVPHCCAVLSRLRRESPHTKQDTWLP
jgi:hypothetical protein